MFLTLDMIDRINYSVASRLPVAINTAKQWGVMTAAGQLINEGDFILGDRINPALMSQAISIDEGVREIVLETGERYRLTFEVSKGARNVVLPGSGFITDETTGHTIRIYKLAYREGNLLDVDIEIMPPKEKTVNGRPAYGAIVTIPVIIVVGIVGAILLGITVYGYYTLREVRKIIVSPAGFILVALIALLVIPPLMKQLPFRSGGGKW